MTPPLSATSPPSAATAAAASDGGGSAAAASTTSSVPKIAARTVQRLREAVQTNPVTVVIGPTGSGKSTQIPQILLEGNDDGGPILVTQPRRLAVVAVSTRVAAERNVRLGGAVVGYHVGQAKQCGANTQLVFCTAGILLEHLCTMGVKVLLKYKCVILDECHERSSESDLVLTLLRSLLQQHAATKPIRLVLMSATFDHERYKRYFSSVPGCERIETINLETADQLDAQRVTVRYLDDIFQRIPHLATRHATFRRVTQVNPDDDLNNLYGGNVQQGAGDGGKSLSDPLVNFVVDLVHHLHTREADGVWLIFAPTYRHLEQLFLALREHRPRDDNRTWKVAVLHSSVDMEHCLRTMKESQPNNDDDDSAAAPPLPPPRKILLASAIADSSVTIPNVTVVMDLCRSLQVTWKAALKAHAPKTVWSSHAICNQRKGRTGRTCAGTVYRLLPQAFYLQRLPAYEVPQLTTASCRDEALKLLCAAGNKSNKRNAVDPTQLLTECLDPPPSAVVEQSLEYLQSIGACQYEARRGRRSATLAGQLMAALAFPVEDAHLILTGGRLALLHEVLVLRAIGTHKPMPLVHHFGDKALNQQILGQYYHEAGHGNTSATATTLAHLSAFLFWDGRWNGGRCRAMLQQFAQVTSGSTAADLSPELWPFGNEWSGSSSSSPCGHVTKWTPALEDKHVAWCARYDINPTAVRSIAELVSHSLTVLFHVEYEPEWLRCTDPTPTWRQPTRTNLPNDSTLSSTMLQNAYGSTKGRALINVLTALCENPSWATEYANQLAKGLRTPVMPTVPAAPQRYVCIHFLRGKCQYGAKCRNAHDLQAPRPPCKFYARGCANENCLYAHNDDDAAAAATTNGNTVNAAAVLDPSQLLQAVAPLKPTLQLPYEGFLGWIQARASKTFLLGEGSFELTRALAALQMPPRAASDKALGVTDDNGDAEPVLLEIGSTTLLQLDATRLHLNAHVQTLTSSDHDDAVAVDTFVWMFPDTGAEEDDGSQEALLLATFLSLAQLVPPPPPQAQSDNVENTKRLHLGLALQGNQFTRWNVLSSALKVQWHLTAWGPIQDDLEDATLKKHYQPRDEQREPLAVRDARFYHFVYQPVATVLPEAPLAYDDDDHDKEQDYREVDEDEYYQAEEYYL